MAKGWGLLRSQSMLVACESQTNRERDTLLLNRGLIAAL